MRLMVVEEMGGDEPKKWRLLWRSLWWSLTGQANSHVDGACEVLWNYSSVSHVALHFCNSAIVCAFCAFCTPRAPELMTSKLAMDVTDH
jgi:hypothetical protein